MIHTQVYPSELQKFLPKPIEVDDGRYACEYRLHKHEISFYDGNIEFRVQNIWEGIYFNAIHKVTSLIMGRQEHFVVRYIPELLHDMDFLILRVVYEVMVAHTRDVVIPTFVYEEHTTKVIEWRCGYCGVPNEIKHKTCCKCGAPRALLIQEMR